MDGDDTDMFVDILAKHDEMYQTNMLKYEDHICLSCH